MEGYAKVAQLMGAHPEFAIFRRFGALNIQNMLYLQAELTHLEADLRRIASEDIKHGDRKYHPYDWWSMAHGQSDGDPEQWWKVLEIREKLEKYNDAILKHAAISRLSAPRDHDLQFFRSWFERPSMGAFPLLGLDRHTWSVESERDFVALTPRKSSDPFSQWFTDRLMPVFHHAIGHRFKRPVSEGLGTGLYEYNDKALAIIARLASTVIASVLPLCSIVILYVVKSNGLRLGIIGALSGCFSLALALMTNARKIEIFAATSAFAAVNVVYLTNGAPCPAAT